MTRFELILRVLLYIALATLPVVIAGIQAHTALILIVLTAAYQAALTLRSFVDSSVTDHKFSEMAQAEVDEQGKIGFRSNASNS